MDKINNKNAREKALLEEAYGNVYKENFNPRRDAPSHKRGDLHPATRAAEDIVDREVMWGRYSGVVDEVDVERGVAWVITDDDGGLHEVELGNFDHIGDKREREDEENPDADTYDAQGEEPAEMVSLTPGAEEEEAGDGEDTQKPLFRVGQFVMGNDGEEIVTQVDEDGTVYTVVVTDKGNSYRPGDEQEDLTDAEEYAKYASMSSYRPAYGEY